MRIETTSPAVAALDKPHRDLKNACQQFESYFTDLMLKEMRKTVPRNNLMGDQSNQQQIFQDMMDQTLADTLSHRSNFGLGQMMYNELAPALDPEKAPDVGGKPSAGQDIRQ